MKNSKLVSQLIAIFMIITGSGAFGTPLTLKGSCGIYVKGSKGITHPIDLNSCDLKYNKVVDINVPDCNGGYTKFTANIQLSALDTPDRVSANIRLTSNGNLIGASYIDSAAEGTMFDFYSKLLDDSFFLCNLEIL